MTLQSKLEEIRQRAERPTRHTKDDVLLLLDMVQEAIRVHRIIERNTCCGQCREAALFSGKVLKELEEMAKGKEE